MSGGDITVVGGGWSVLDIDRERLAGLVIGVNDAAVYLPRVDVVVSMDRLWTEYRWPWLTQHKRPAHLRRSAVQKIKAGELEAAAGWLHVFDCKIETDRFDDRPGWLNGCNSGACALNLAWQLRPARVFLLGFDMCRDRHGVASWHPPYPWTKPTGATTNGKYAAWAGLFATAAAAFKGAGVEVFNVAPGSAIKAFPKMQPAAYARVAT